MSPTARSLQFDFVRFAAGVGLSNGFDELLMGGGNEMTRQQRSLFPCLATWPGTKKFLSNLQAFVGSSKEPLLASRSRTLVRIAARLCLTRCERLLITDLGWPPWQEVFCRLANRLGRRVIRIELRERIYRDQISASEVANIITQQFLASSCHGMFLPAISHDGIRLPIEDIARRLASTRNLRFLVVDGSQEVGHARSQISDFVDMYLAGSHKWLASYLPTGIAFCERNESSRYIQKSVNRWIRQGRVDDPLLVFSRQLSSRALDERTETVNLTSLFACFGALEDANRQSPSMTFPDRLRNGAVVNELMTNTAWSASQPHKSLRTGIVMLGQDRGRTSSSPQQTRLFFESSGVTLTAFKDARIRLSMPAQPWKSSQLEVLQSALQRNRL